MSDTTKRRAGRPRKEDQREKVLTIDGKTYPLEPSYFSGDFVGKCRARYLETATTANGADTRSSEIIRGGFAATGDQMFFTDPAQAARIYGLAGSTRPSSAVADLARKIRGSEADIIADYARAYARNVGISLHLAIADGVATCAERGTFVRSRGRAVSFERAVRSVYEAMKRPLFDPGVGDSGRRLHVKPARPGHIVPIPEQAMRPMRPEGETVPDNHYWRRRIADGSVVLVP